MHGDVMRGVFGLIQHCFRYRRRYGKFPSHLYLMCNFELDIEIAESMLEYAEMIAAREGAKETT